MYTVQEYVDMLLILGECQGSYRAAAVTYVERYPNRQHPHKNVFQRLEHRVRETGRMDHFREVPGRPRTARTPGVEEAVLAVVEDNPNESIRGIARNLNLTSSTVQRVLRAERYHPFHYTKVHALLESDFPLRVNFCRWMQDRIAANENFGRSIAWTDEATFTREGIFNMHNHHYWGLENPNVVRRRAFQNRFSVHVWAGILGSKLIGPFFLPDRLNGDNFLNFLQRDFQNLLDDVPLGQLRNFEWLQMDGAPAHYSGQVRQWLNENYPERWIGRGGPVPWPPRSPDLTMLDFFLWGHIKNIVYRTAPDTVEELRQRIIEAAATVTPEMLDNVHRSTGRRINRCVAVNGRNFEHLL